ncbi:hypothetical protein MZM54_27450 [[Brevibacterium] frigoritolerans]|nr:hypothetical protein [Peribacillus frigoritolerans]
MDPKRRNRIGYGIPIYQGYVQPNFYVDSNLNLVTITLFGKIKQMFKVGHFVYMFTTDSNNMVLEPITGPMQLCKS